MILRLFEIKKASEAMPSFVANTLMHLGVSQIGFRTLISSYQFAYHKQFSQLFEFAQTFMTKVTFWCRNIQRGSKKCTSS